MNNSIRVFSVMHNTRGDRWWRRIEIDQMEKGLFPNPFLVEYLAKIFCTYFRNEPKFNWNQEEHFAAQCFNWIFVHLKWNRMQKSSKHSCQLWTHSHTHWMPYSYVGEVLAWIALRLINPVLQILVWNQAIDVYTVTRVYTWL